MNLTPEQQIEGIRTMIERRQANLTAACERYAKLNQRPDTFHRATLIREAIAEAKEHADTIKALQHRLTWAEANLKAHDKLTETYLSA